MARRQENGFWSGVEKAAEKATKVAKWAVTRTYRVTAADYDRAPRKTFKIRATSAEEALKLAERKYGDERYGQYKVKNPMRRTNPETVEAQLRTVLEQGVNVFGFAGVLNILADEASERIDDDESAQPILDAIETAIEEISECEECEDEDSEEEEFDDADNEEEDDEE